MTDDDSLMRQIPPTDRILGNPAVQTLIARTSRAFVHQQLERLLDRLRVDARSGEPSRLQAARARLADLPAALDRQVEAALQPSLQRVINATGVIIHTNLGRAPLAAQVARSLEPITRGYSNLEFDLASGNRGRRDSHLESALRDVLGCEAATAVNNNAAAIYLVLNELAAGGEVIVSRGELMEIGGSFRIPDILRKSQAVLREVGTTNRTRASDYAQAVNENTRLLLKVHPSNYRISGFTEAASLAELAELARRHGLPLVEDLGSGLLLDLAAQGIDEPLAAASLAAGADLITFSGDKMLGGPQAGIIAGRESLLARIRKNPLMRVLRLDKTTLAALEATLNSYRSGRAAEEIPVLRMIREPGPALRRRAQALRRRLRRAAAADWSFAIVSVDSVVGGGSCPGVTLPSWAVSVSTAAASAAEVEARLRRFSPPVVARVEENRILLDVRTLLPGDDDALARFFQ